MSVYLLPDGHVQIAFSGGCTSGFTKKTAGRNLDGVTHDGFPEGAR